MSNGTQTIHNNQKEHNMNVNPNTLPKPKSAPVVAKPQRISIAFSSVSAMKDESELLGPIGIALLKAVQNKSKL